MNRSGIGFDAHQLEKGIDSTKELSSDQLKSAVNLSFSSDETARN